MKNSKLLALISATAMALSVTVSQYGFAEENEVSSVTNISGSDAREYGTYYTVDSKGNAQVSCINSSAKDLIIPEYIDNHAVILIDISDCDNLETVMIPKTVTKIYEIIGCPNIREFNVAEENEYYCSINGVLYNKDCSELLYYPPEKEDSKFEAPASLTSIAQEAFASNQNLKNVVIPKNVTGAMSGAFYGCNSLETIIFLRENIVSDPLNFIYDYSNVLEGCESFPTVYVPDSAIEDYERAIQSEKYTLLPLSKKNVIDDFESYKSADDISAAYKNTGIFTPVSVSLSDKAYSGNKCGQIDFSLVYDKTADMKSSIFELSKGLDCQNIAEYDGISFMINLNGDDTYTVPNFSFIDSNNEFWDMGKDYDFGIDYKNSNGWQEIKIPFSDIASPPLGMLKYPDISLLNGFVISGSNERVYNYAMDKNHVDKYGNPPIEKAEGSWLIDDIKLYKAGDVSDSQSENQLWEKFLKYDLCITDYDSLTDEQKELAKFIYETEEIEKTTSTPNTISNLCVRARKILAGEDVGERLTLEQLEDSYGIYDGVTGYGWLNYINCVPDVFRLTTPDTYAEYWLDDKGEEKVIYSGDTNQNNYKYYIPSKNLEIPVKEFPFRTNREKFNLDGEPLDFSEAIEVNGDYYYITPENKAVLLKCGHCPLTYDRDQEPINEAHVIVSEVEGCPVTAIEDWAMTYAPFTEIVLPDTVEYIGYRALSSDHLEKVNFPKSLKYMKDGAVNLNCDKLTIDCPELVMENDAIGGTFSEAYINAKEIGEEELMSCYYLKKVVFGDAVEKIDACVNDFYGKNFKIESVELPEGLRVIGQGAFKMDSLKEITIPKSVEIIGAVQKTPTALTFISMDYDNSRPVGNTICAFSPDCVIKGYKGTEAERYANEWGLTFVALDEETTGTIIGTKNENGDIYGDADGNGEVSVTDAVAVMSFVTNSEKYGLTKSAQQIADVYNTGDGINNMDALEIQKYLANIIN